MIDLVLRTACIDQLSINSPAYHLGFSRRPSHGHMSLTSGMRCTVSSRPCFEPYTGASSSLSVSTRC